MYLETPTDPITTNIDQSRIHKYNIKENRKMFHILQDGIYSDKVRAVIRELACNAADSHIEAGQTRPFEITLPNFLSPEFKIKDFGVGLSKDSVYKVFTTYGESTKDKKTNALSQKLTGMLGLGSKSPFAIVESYNIISCFDGTKTTYLAYKDGDGLPSILLVSEEPTDEVNGVEISFPVLATDFNAFQERAAYVLRHFDPEPIVKGAPSGKFAISRRNYAYTGKNGWRCYDGGYNYGAIAIMGKIEYPIEAANIKNITPEQREFLKLSIEIDFELGELDFAASREKLSYDNDTTKAIQDRLDLIIKEIVDGFSAEFVSCKTKWEAHCKYGSIFFMGHMASGTHLFPRAVATFLQKAGIPAIWQGQTISSNHLDIPLKELAELGDVYLLGRFHCQYFRKTKKITGIKTTALQGLVDKKILSNVIGRDDNNIKVMELTDKSVLHIAAESDLLVVFGKKHSGSLASLTEETFSGKTSPYTNKNIIFIQAHHKTTPVDMTKSAKALLKIFDGCPIVAYTAKQKTVVRPEQVFPVWKFNETYEATRCQRYRGANWTRYNKVESIPTHPGVVKCYVELKANEPIIDGQTFYHLSKQHRELSILLATINEFDKSQLKMPVVYGIRQTNIKKFIKSGKIKDFIRFDEYLKDFIFDVFVNHRSFLQRLRDSTEINTKVSNSPIGVIPQSLQSSDFQKAITKMGLDDSHIIPRLIEQYNSLSRNKRVSSDACGDIISLFTKYGFEYKAFTKPWVEEDLGNQFLAKYPLLKYIPQNLFYATGVSAIKDCVAYISQIDKNNKE